MAFQTSMQLRLHINKNIFNILRIIKYVANKLVEHSSQRSSKFSAELSEESNKERRF